MRAGKSSTSGAVDLLKVMYCLRREGREPGRVASSMRSWASVSRRTKVRDDNPAVAAVVVEWEDLGRDGGRGRGRVGLEDGVRRDGVEVRGVVVVDRTVGVSRAAAAVTAAATVASSVSSSPASGRLVGAEGCDMAFWPVICVPSSKPALMWCVKLLFMAGSVATLEGIAQMVERR